MDIFTWFLQLNESASQLIQNQLNANDSILIAYVCVSLIIKRAAFLAAFFMSCLLFEVSFFDSLSECNLYLITFLIYTYAFQTCLTRKERYCCGIILFLSMAFTVDAGLYGEFGYYGASETIIYNNIELLATSAHIFLISTLIPYRRIKDSIRRFAASAVYMSNNSAYFLVL